MRWGGLADWFCLAPSSIPPNSPKLLPCQTTLENMGGFQSMAYLLQFVEVGLVSGCIYALISLGYTMVYGIIELINFAHGDIFMIGTFVCITVFGLLGVTGASHPGGFTLVGI